jgi:hypothetical protein
MFVQARDIVVGQVNLQMVISIVAKFIWPLIFSLTIEIKLIFED